MIRLRPLVWLVTSCTCFGCLRVLRPVAREPDRSHVSADVASVERKGSKFFLGDRIVDVETGAVVTTVSVHPTRVYQPWVQDGSTAYAVGAAYLYAIRLSDGKVRWRVPADGRRTIDQTATTVLALNIATSAQIYDKATGRELRSGKHLWPLVCPLAGDRIVLLSRRLTLQVQEAQSGRILREAAARIYPGVNVLNPGFRASPDGEIFCVRVLSDKTVVVECRDSNLHLLSRTPLPIPVSDKARDEWEIHRVGSDFVVAAPTEIWPERNVPIWVARIPGGNVIIKARGTALSPVLGAHEELEAGLVLDPVSSTLSLFDTRSGQRRWSVPARGDRVESVMVGQRLVVATYFVHSSGAVLRALDPATGRTLWESTPPALTSYIMSPAGYGMRLWLLKRPGGIVAKYLESSGSYVQVFDARDGVMQREFMPQPERPLPDPGLG